MKLWKHSIYEDVSKVLEENKARYTIVMGDFNTEFSMFRESQPEEETVEHPRKFGYE